MLSVLDPLLRHPSTSVLLFDFDGTLSPTVADPAAAAAAEGFIELLVELNASYALVGIISGRPVSFLEDRLPSELVLSGQYGLETVTAGVTTSRPGAGRWRTAVASAATAASAAFADHPAIGVEPKGLSITVHYRHDPGAEPLVRDSMQRLAHDTGLVTHDAKLSIELRPPVDTDKGTVVRELAAGAEGVLYVGDDVGDVPAFQAVAELRRSGMAGVSVAVDGPESPAEVRDSVDLTVVGQTGLRELLEALLRSR